MSTTTKNVRPVYIPPGVGLGPDGPTRQENRIQWTLRLMAGGRTVSDSPVDADVFHVLHRPDPNIRLNVGDKVWVADRTIREALEASLRADPIAGLALPRAKLTPLKETLRAGKGLTGYRTSRKEGFYRVDPVTAKVIGKGSFLDNWTEGLRSRGLVVMKDGKAEFKIASPKIRFFNDVSLHGAYVYCAKGKPPILAKDKEGNEDKQASWKIGYFDPILPGWFQFRARYFRQFARSWGLSPSVRKALGATRWGSAGRPLGFSELLETALRELDEALRLIDRYGPPKKEDSTWPPVPVAKWLAWLAEGGPVVQPLEFSFHELDAWRNMGRPDLQAEELFSLATDYGKNLIDFLTREASADWAELQEKLYRVTHARDEEYAEAFLPHLDGDSVRFLATHIVNGEEVKKSQYSGGLRRERAVYPERYEELACADRTTHITCGAPASAGSLRAKGEALSGKEAESSAKSRSWSLTKWDPEMPLWGQDLRDDACPSPLNVADWMRVARSRNPLETFYYDDGGYYWRVVPKAEPGEKTKRAWSVNDDGSVTLSEPEMKTETISSNQFDQLSRESKRGWTYARKTTVLDLPGAKFLVPQLQAVETGMKSVDGRKQYQSAEDWFELLRMYDKLQAVLTALTEGTEARIAAVIEAGDEPEEEPSWPAARERIRAFTEECSKRLEILKGVIQQFGPEVANLLKEVERMVHVRNEEHRMSPEERDWLTFQASMAVNREWEMADDDREQPVNDRKPKIKGKKGEWASCRGKRKSTPVKPGGRRKPLRRPEPVRQYAADQRQYTGPGRRFGARKAPHQK